jgi:surface polysaccharide O-acyltransferase-like enzyme
MILRRLGEAIPAQNWFVVAIEIAIVFIGILMRLQVDGWNESRKVGAIQFLKVHQLLDKALGLQH